MICVNYLIYFELYFRISQIHPYFRIHHPFIIPRLSSLLIHLTSSKIPFILVYIRLISSNLSLNNTYQQHSKTMLINDYSQQSWTDKNTTSPISLSEILTAGMIFILPVIFLLVIAAK